MTGYGTTDFGDVRRRHGGVRGGKLDRHGARRWVRTSRPRRSGRTRPKRTWSSCRAATSASESFNDIPTITDKLQVFGDIRMGTTGTNGCLKNFAGTGLIGTCSSDRRFKKDITPFTPVLNQLTALQPVHYFWRAADFPQQHFGDSRAYGLIAQDVEAVLPELVVTGEDGFKAVDYTKLPLLTIQAVKELKAENDAPKRGERAETARRRARAAGDRHARESGTAVIEIETNHNQEELPHATDHGSSHTSRRGAHRPSPIGRRNRRPRPSVTVPRLIQITGVFQPVDGQPPSAVEIVTLSVYAEADGGLPVWQERQTVAIEKTTGRFTLLLGASYPAGIPADVFALGRRRSG